MDSLAIYDTQNASTSKYSRIKSVQVPEKWSGWMAYQVHPEKDTSKAAKKNKKYSKDNGYPLVIRALGDTTALEIPYVTSYQVSRKGDKIVALSTGNDSTFLKGIYVFDAKSQEVTPVFRAKGEYKSLCWDEEGKQLSFTVDLDTTKALVRYPDLVYWTPKQDSATIVVSSKNLNDEVFVSQDYKNRFSKDGSKLYFGLAPYPIVEDTSLLEEEIVNVEIWNYKDSRMHTQQQIEKDNDRKRAYASAYFPASKTYKQLANEKIPEVELETDGNASYAVGVHQDSYLERISWEGFPPYSDYHAINVNTGQSKLFAKETRGYINVSPSGKFAYWYNRLDSTWTNYEFGTGKTYRITSNDEIPFYQEVFDIPSIPGPYGVMSWTKGDKKVLIYDRYDIWEVDPQNKANPKRITTDGREKKIVYRYVKLDPEERYIEKGQELLIRAFYEEDKHEALFSMTYGKGDLTKLTEGHYLYREFKKAEDADQLMYSRQNFETFPDMRSTDLLFSNDKLISNANPQQKEYSWGTIELYKWTSLDGQELEGMLVKPEGFDPDKKYPMIVNFYEKSSNGLNRHRPPSPGRSTISYSFYTSRGYVIFNPDVHYKTGYPGESAYNCVIPGVTSLIEEGFVDKDRIGVQGHSWGGYQIAHLVTRTNIFKCAESGAPVANMISAYGGIRWWTGLSRMFQYEHTQSRIGGTLWEYPRRYIENSPIFYIDRIETPVLIMHNDEDGHVPWYQGIEFFASLRRLNKPAWMLNYQGEPHWPVKKHLKIDFQTRMAQFFDHYLMDQPMPEWMDGGIPAVEVGIEKRLELVED